MRPLVATITILALTCLAATACAQECCDACGQAPEACTCYVPNRYFSISVGSSYEQFDSVFAGPFVYDYSDGSAIQFKLGQRLHRYVAAELQFESAGGHDLEGRIMWLGTHPSTLTLDTDTSIWSATANLKLIAAFWGVEPYVVVGGGVLGGSIYAPGLVDIEGTGPMIRAGVGLDMPLYGSHYLNTEWSTSIPFGDAEPFEHQSLTFGLGWWF